MKRLNTTTEWVGLLEQSGVKPFIILKVSLTCSLSGYVVRDMGKLGKEIEDITYKVVVQESRDVSDAIAEDLGITHETPQIIILQKGKVIYEAHHEEIEASTVQSVLADLKD